jgi:hypothetical protein
VRLNAFIYDAWELAGIDFTALAPHLGSIRSSNYDEQEGRIDYMEHKRQFLLAVRAAAGDDILFLCWRRSAMACATPTSRWGRSKAAAGEAILPS